MLALGDGTQRAVTSVMETDSFMSGLRCHQASET